jgi:MoaA/NifB/PqqE/SkfB family radical SAM enzyme
VSRVQLAPGVRIRPEAFGAIAYVPDRDHFFGLSGAAAAAVTGAADADAGTVETLAGLGVLDTDPPTDRRPHFGESLVGNFAELPVVTEPLVVNCFATAHCPLRCRYCHADDLMGPFRVGESGDEPWSVLRTAAAVPALVAVVTGGEPLSRPARTEILVRELAESGKAVVLDTSGVGDLEPLVPGLRKHRAHLRVSLDSPDARANDRFRPVNRRYLPMGTSAWAHAVRALDVAHAEGVPVSVQTVVTSRNEDAGTLIAMRDWLVARGVRHWVLHVVVPVGRAAESRNRGLRTSPYVIPALAELVKKTADDGVPVNIRVTGTHRAPNSVLLIGSRGDLYVERGSGGKIRIAGPDDPREAVLEAFRAHVNLVEHVSRYLNGSIQPFPHEG